ncbi:hypothetical protein EVB87_099 [Rhizobium phage RHph_N28_1]|nr:hypothetical protein EVB87_099 [Rhizobium phage RHph_N28_1]QIG74127.1 hypothetical protein EVC07_099 [Rhizobium phage RHph_N42]QXV73786.1 hypothetical protein [Rhizobium phage RHph_N46]
MSEVTISEEEFRRLKALAGEADEPKPSVTMCSLTGHAWQSYGGANAGCEMPECDCSVAVYQCALCGDFDYGERDRQETHDNCFARKEWLEEQEALKAMEVEDGES